MIKYLYVQIKEESRERVLATSKNYCQKDELLKYDQDYDLIQLMSLNLLKMKISLWMVVFLKTNDGDEVNAEYDNHCGDVDDL
jgi:beta-galactosidase beta subunit